MLKKARKYMVGMVLCIVLMLVVPIGIAIGNMTGPGYILNYKVHSYMENAYFANTPELMKDNLFKCQQGMRDLGLTENLYDAYWSWDRIPHRQMTYQYQHIDSIISRTNAVVQWRNENYGNESSGIPSESLGDVYEQKMDNLRGFLKEEGWSDWIACGTFYANFHTFYYLGELIGSIWVLFFLAITILLGWTVVRKWYDWDNEYQRQQRDESNRIRNR